MKDIRRKEKEIKSQKEMAVILKGSKYITVAMCADNEPYLVSLSHGYDESNNCLYFHCAGDGKKIDILKQNPVVWGQALADRGYVQGKCDHHYATVQFRGTVRFILEIEEKKRALEIMIEGLEDHPEMVKGNQLTGEAVTGVTVGRIDIDYLTGKKSKEVTL